MLAVLPKTTLLTLFNLSLVGVAEGGGRDDGGEDVVHSLKVSLEDLYLGTFIEGVIGGSVPWNIKEAFSNLECDLLHVQWVSISVCLCVSNCSLFVVLLTWDLLQCMLNNRKGSKS